MYRNTTLFIILFSIIITSCAYRNLDVIVKNARYIKANRFDCTINVIDSTVFKEVLFELNSDTLRQHNISSNRDLGYTSHDELINILAQLNFVEIRNSEEISDINKELNGFTKMINIHSAGYDLTSGLLDDLRKSRNVIVTIQQTYVDSISDINDELIKLILVDARDKAEQKASDENLTIIKMSKFQEIVKDDLKEALLEKRGGFYSLKEDFLENRQTTELQYLQEKQLKVFFKVKPTK